MLYDGSTDADTTIILAHGAGAGMDSPAMEAFARGLAGEDLRVVRFEFPYMQRRRDTGKRGGPDRPPVLMESWRRAVATAGALKHREALKGKKVVIVVSGGNVTLAQVEESIKVYQKGR